MYVVIFSALLITAIGLLFMATNAHGEQGGTGPGTGCAPNDACTTAGTDWLKFSSDSNSNPRGFQAFIKNKNGTRTQWADVASTCRNSGNNSVWVFVAYYSDRSYRFKGLNYTPADAGLYQNTQATISTVKANYDSANFHDPGWSWGSNVAWFCWSDNPPWTINVTSSADKAIIEPGEAVTWTHKISNNGPSTTNKSITWYYQNRGDWPNTSGGTTTFASGNGAGASATQTSTYVAQASDFGKKICRSTSAAPATNTNSATVESSPATCVIVGKKPKTQIHGGDLFVGRPFTGNALIPTSSVETSITQKAPRTAVLPPYDSSMISGLWATGVDANSKKLPAGSSDPHWQLANVYKANANGTTLLPASKDSAHWSSASAADTCQPGPYPRDATTVDTSLLNAGGNSAWNASLPNSSWIGAYKDANNTTHNSSCTYPAMSNTLNDTTFKKGAIWSFKLKNGFNIDSCVDPSTIRLKFNLSADDEVQILVNGKSIAEPGDFSHYGQWPSTPVSYTTSAAAAGAFATGSNSLELRIKSAYEYTGLLVDSLSVASASCAPVIPNNMFGSWVEYGIFSIGTIKGAASGSAFNGGAAVGTRLCDYTKLSFVNAGTSNPATACSDTSVIGTYSTNRTIPNVAANFAVVAGTTPVFDNAIANPQGLFTSKDTGTPPVVVSDPITIGNPATPKTIARGQWMVINAPNAEVTIVGDITYANGPFQSIGDIPQVIIIAKNIHIAANVKQVDAWLIAQGSKAANTGILDTCAISNSYTTQLTANICNLPLIVNGPVMAQHLWLRRTAGSGADDHSGDPAEVFNLRPDAYLWGYARASTSGHVETVYSNELPPRF